MNTLLQKSDPAAIGKPVTASVPVDYHSTAAISPTGFGAGAWAYMGVLKSWKDAPDGNTWLEVDEGNETKFLLFLPGNFYLLDGQGEATKLKLLQKPLAVFGTVAGGLVLLALMVGVIIYNMVKNKQRK
jgi:hypothetical protein